MTAYRKNSNKSKMVIFPKFVTNLQEKSIHISEEKRTLKVKNCFSTDRDPVRSDPRESWKSALGLHVDAYLAV